MVDGQMAEQPKQKAYFVLQTFKQGIQRAADLMKTMLPSDIETTTCVIGTKTDELEQIVKEGDSIVIVGAPVGVFNWNGKAEGWIKRFNRLVVQQQENLQAWQKKATEEETKRKEAEAKQKAKAAKGKAKKEKGGSGKGKDSKAIEAGETKEGTPEDKKDEKRDVGSTSPDRKDEVSGQVKSINTAPPVWKGLLAMYYTVEEDLVSDSYNDKIMKLVLNLDLHKQVLADFLSVPVQKDSFQLVPSSNAAIKEFMDKILTRRPKRNAPQV